MRTHRLLSLALFLVFTGATQAPSNDDWITVAPGSKDPFALLVAGYFQDAKTWNCGWRAFSAHGSAPFAVPNLTSVSHCPTEVIVAAPGKAMRIIPINAFTERGGDKITVTSAPQGRRRVPVSAWSIDSSLASGLPQYMEHANDVFDRCGIGFDLSLESPELTAASRLQLQGAGCDQAEELQKTASKAPGAVYLFLLRERPQYRGAWCGNGESPYKHVVLLYRSASATTLAHELGHALALEHPPFIDDNVMADIGRGTHVTLGQCFRSHFAAGSILSGSTGSAPRRCDDAKDGAMSRCPPLELDLP